MCWATRHGAKCGCVWVEVLERCPKFKGSKGCCTAPTDLPVDNKWSFDYCREHEALRRQFDAQVMLFGNKTEHGYRLDSTWAASLRYTGDLKDQQYYVQRGEPRNPYSLGAKDEDVASNMVLKKMKDVGGNANDREGWIEFQMRLGGKSYAPRFPGGPLTYRERRHKKPLVPLRDLYPDISCQEAEAAARVVAAEAQRELPGSKSTQSRRKLTGPTFDGPSLQLTSDPYKFLSGPGNATAAGTVFCSNGLAPPPTDMIGETDMRHLLRPVEEYNRSVSSQASKPHEAGLPQRSESWGSDKLSTDEEEFVKAEDYVRANSRRIGKGKSPIDFTGDGKLMWRKRQLEQ